MKREPNTNPNRNPNGSGRGNGSYNGNRTDSGFVQSSPVGDNTYGKDGQIFDSGDLSNSVTEFVPIRQTPAYKHAYELFSKLEDRKWLLRLEAIADSVPYYEPNSWLSEIFNQEKYWNKNKEAVSLGVQQINALVAEYQEFQNSLPETQVQQYADANLNPLTQSYSGSNINPQNTITSAGVPDITPTSEIISSLVSLASSASGGLMSFLSTGIGIFKTMSELKFRERDQLIQMAGKGFTPSSKDVMRGNKDFLQNRLFPSPFAQSSSAKQFIENNENQILGTLSADLYGTIFNQEEVTDVYKDLSKLNFEIFMNDFRNRNSLFKRQFAENTLQEEIFGNVSPDFEAGKINSLNLAAIEHGKTSAAKSKSDRSLENTFYGILQKWIDKAQKGSFAHQYLILNLRNSGNTGVSDAISNGLNAAKTLNSLK